MYNGQYNINEQKYNKMKKIKVALLSYGMSGKIFHAPFLKLHPGFELLGSWERSSKNIQNDYPNTLSYPSIESILEDKTIELVVVNTPIDSHFEYAKKVLLAGKHALVEKAFTATLAEAKELAALAKERNLKLFVFQNRRWDSDFKTVQKILNDKVLGDLVEAEIHFDRYNPVLSPKVHKESANSGSGILRDLGPHIIDQALTLFGMPQAVFADIRLTREHTIIEDYFDILLYYPDIRVRLKSSFFVREVLPSYIFHGKIGSFLKSRGDVQEDELKLGKKPNLESWGTEPIAKEGTLHTEIDGDIFFGKVLTLQGNYYDFFDDIYQSIINDITEPVSAQDGANVMEIIEAATQSSEEKRVIYL